MNGKNIARRSIALVLAAAAVLQMVSVAFIGRGERK